MEHSRIIVELEAAVGGRKHLSDELTGMIGKPVSYFTIANWKHRNAIARGMHLPVYVLCEQNNIGATPEDFFATL